MTTVIIENHGNKSVTHPIVVLGEGAEQGGLPVRKSGVSESEGEGVSE